MGPLIPWAGNEEAVAGIRYDLSHPDAPQRAATREKVMILREMIRLYLAVHKIGQNELAREMGMSISTFSRFLRGKEMDFQNHVKVLVWMAKEDVGCELPEEKRP